MSIKCENCMHFINQELKDYVSTLMVEYMQIEVPSLVRVLKDLNIITKRKKKT